MNKTKQLGDTGEQIVFDFLKNSGAKIIATNFHSRFGEADIISLQDETLAFIEVKTRKSNPNFGLSSVITPSKQKKIIKTAKVFIMKHPEYEQKNIRFDVALVTGKDKKIEYIKNAFYGE